MDIVHSFTYHSFTESSFNKDKPSDLIGRVICLPYKIERIIDSLNDIYLVELKKGLAQEIIENEKDQNQVVRWDEYLKHFIACEYFEKVEQIIEERMGGLDALMKSDYNLYELGWEIILKSLLNVLFLDQERDTWSQRFKKYLTNLANNIEVRLHDQTRSPYILFEYSQDWPKKLGGDIYGLFKHLFKIYDTHPIFSNYEAWEKIDLTGLRIGEICDYFSIWRNNIISLQDYIGLRETKYPEHIIAVANFVGDTSLDTNDCILAVKEIERRELLGLCSCGNLSSNS
jgi:glutaredoxin 2